MKKTLINVKLPATGKTYDFLVPKRMQMQEASQLVARALEVAEPGFFKARRDNVLVYIPTGDVQDPNATLAEAGFSDGDPFVLM